MSKSTESFYKRLKKQLEISNKWPTQYKFKFIIKSEKNDEKKLIEIFKDLNPKQFQDQMKEMEEIIIL